MGTNQILNEIIVQIVGFLVVFFVLKKLAWRRLLEMIDTRRQAIEGQLAEVEKKKKDLADLEKDYRARLEHIEQEARTKIQEAANIGLALAKDIQDKARQDAQKMVDRAQAEITHDLAKAKLSLRNDIVQLSALIVEKVIREKLDAREHEKLVDKYLKELEKVSG